MRVIWRLGVYADGVVHDADIRHMTQIDPQQLDVVRLALQSDLLILFAVSLVFISVGVAAFLWWAGRFNNRQLTLIQANNEAFVDLRRAINQQEATTQALFERSATIREAEIAAKEALGARLDAMNTTVSGVPEQVRASFDTQQTRINMTMATQQTRIQEMSEHITQLVNVISRINDRVGTVDDAMRNFNIRHLGTHDVLLEKLGSLQNEVGRVLEITERIKGYYEQDASNADDRVGAAIGGADAIGKRAGIGTGNIAPGGGGGRGTDE